MKQVEVFDSSEDDDWLVISIIVRFLAKSETRRVQLTYDPRRKIPDPRLREMAGVQVETVWLSDEVNIDLSPDGTVYGMELLNANAQLHAYHDERFVRVDEVAGSRVGVPLPELA